MKSLGLRSGNLASIRFRTRFLISMSLNFLICFHCFYFFDQFPCMKPVHCPQSCYDLPCLGSRGPAGHCCRARLWAPQAAANPAEPLASRGLLSSTPLLGHLPSFSFWTEWFRKEDCAFLLCVCVCMCVSHVRHFATPWTIAQPGSPVRGISQARILEWVAISSSRGSSQPRNEPVSPALAGGFITIEPPREAYFLLYFSLFLVCLFWLKYNLNTVKYADLKCSTQWNFTFVNTYVITQIRHLSTSAKHPSWPFSDTPTPGLPLLYTSTID